MHEHKKKREKWQKGVVHCVISEQTNSWTRNKTNANEMVGSYTFWKLL